MDGEKHRDYVALRCDLHAPATPLPHFWEHTVGSGHAALALRSDWQTHLYTCHGDLGFRHVRFHGILSDDLYTVQKPYDRLEYCFFNIDRIYDFLLSVGIRPYVELSFMPSALAAGTQTVFTNRANVTPPADWQLWEDLVRQLAEHLIDRYGTEEVRHWYFEVWNEPNRPQFWSGTQGDYFTLYRHTAEALKAVDSELRIGGPATSANGWIEEFLDFCQSEGLPVDFVSTHHYPNDGHAPAVHETVEQLAQSRRGVLREYALENYRRARGLPVHVTEWNCATDDRLSLHDEPYTAAFLVKSVMEAQGLVENYSFWTFSDLFAETAFPTLPFHGGFGLLNLYGVPKPSYRAFQLLHHVGQELLPAEITHPTVDGWVVRKPHSETVLLTNHALPRHEIKTAQVQIELLHSPPPHVVFIERIDHDHANPKRYWQASQEPVYLTPEEVGHLHVASQLVKEPCPWDYEQGRVRMNVALPPHAVAAVTLEYPSSE